MIRSLLIGAVGGLRSMTPPAALALIAPGRARALPMPLATALMNPWARAGWAAIALGELAGDKWSKAPDRTILPGVAARAATGALAGAALAPPDRRGAGAALGGLGAIAAAYAGLALRRRAMRRYGQVASGFAEDALAIGAAVALVRPRGGTHQR